MRHTQKELLGAPSLAERFAQKKMPLSQTKLNPPSINNTP